MFLRTLVYAACLWIASSASLAAQTVYYLDSQSGSDTADGRSPATAWRTTAPVNSRGFVAGDAVLFKRGGQWRASATLAATGAGTVTLGAYGTGASPILTGADVVPAGWSSVGGGIYTKAVTAPVLQVIVDGQRLAPARSPNTGWFVIDRVISPTQFLSAQAAAIFTAHGVGATQAVFRTSHWSVHRRIVTAFDPATNIITIDTPLQAPYYALTPGWGFVLTGHAAFVDAAGEWQYTPGTQQLRVRLPGSDAPDLHTVEVSTRSVGLAVIGAASTTVRVEDLTIQASGGSGVTTWGPSIEVFRTTVRHSRNYGMSFNSPRVIVRDSVIEDSSDAGIHLYDLTAIAEVTGSTLRRTGVIGSQYQPNIFGAIFARVHQLTLTDNLIEDSGFAGIFVMPRAGDVYHIARNTVRRYCVLFSDCGGIYAAGLHAPDSIYTVAITDNTVLDGIGDVGGVAAPYIPGELTITAIYLDWRLDGAHVARNRIDRAPGSGSGAIKVTGNRNLVEENVIRQYSTWPTISFLKYPPPQVFSMAGNVTRNNQFLVDQIFNATQNMLFVNATTDPDNNVGTFANNTITIAGTPPPPPPAPVPPAPVPPASTDTTPPSITITAPTGSTVPRGRPFTIRATVSDASPIAGSVDLMINEGAGGYICRVFAPPYDCVWNVPSRRGVTYVIRVNAMDRAGNPATVTKAVTAK